MRQRWHQTSRQKYIFFYGSGNENHELGRDFFGTYQLLYTQGSGPMNWSRGKFNGPLLAAPEF
jgi:hypothetical protein